MSEFQKDLFLRQIRQEEEKLGISISGSGEEEEGVEDFVAPLPSASRPETRSSKYVSDIAVAHWSQYFTRDDTFELSKTKYTLQSYYREPSGPSKNPVIFVAHHGAGSSAFTYGPLAERLVEKFSEQQQNDGVDDSEIDTPGFFAFDSRGHGNSVLLNRAGDATKDDYSVESLSADFAALIAQFFEAEDFQRKGIRPSIFLVGHSLGGSVLTKVVKEELIKDQFVRRCVKGLIMLDIVEEIAIKALGSMQSYLDNRPNSFGSLKEAVAWHIKSGLIHNEISAKVSVPYLFEQSSGRYSWLADLQATKPFWDGWFRQLSSNFISIPNSVAKMLMLANHDNLDKYLMIGQMQGKYQLVVFHNDELPLSSTLTTATTTINESRQIGHFIHEDIPTKVALTLMEFVERNDISSDRSNGNSNPQIDFLKKINAKWGVKN
ncbi:unnamed protein product [Kuraishia capsulata CBS 1993]|uniref:Protein phosphatase methylesterase 1 n=1 Tax=Kuraishia capsulata CBS 1993 TaxID=1382522 RepID=W6MHM8_9ASCO|nr:uncharacterized protein KUCA_T00001235001 [Kuraishia capsulata CBS 1993]CDK25268.1 unnamed protein product [Kuraishia capsulata CBS 1993]